MEEAILWNKKRRTLTFINVLVSILFAAFIIFLINYISVREYYRKDLTLTGEHTITEKSIGELRNLKTDVRIFIVLPESRDVLRPDEQQAEKLLRKILDQFVYYSKGKVKYNIATENNVKQVYDLMKQSGQEPILNLGDIILLSGDKYRVLNLSNMYSAHGISTFNGEVELTSAIYSLTEEKKKVYFTMGHSETPLSGGNNALDVFVKILTDRENYEVESFEIKDQENKIPADTDVLIFADPKSEFKDVEVALIRDYLEKGGRILFLLDFKPVDNTNLPAMLSDFGVLIQNDIVVEKDPDRTVRVKMMEGESVREAILADIFYVDKFEQHQITIRMGGARCLFTTAKSVSPVHSIYNQFTTSPLAKTSDDSYTKGDFTSQDFNPEKDRKGPVCVAVAGEGVIKNNEKHTRIVVIGDCDNVSNSALSNPFAREILTSRADLVVNSLHWLVGRNERIGITPRNPADKSIQLVKASESRIKYICLIGLPVFIGMFGIYIWLVRKR